MILLIYMMLSVIHSLATLIFHDVKSSDYGHGAMVTPSAKHMYIRSNLIKMMGLSRRDMGYPRVHRISNKSRQVIEFPVDQAFKTRTIQSIHKMAVYLAKQNNGAMLPSFSERKIGNMMPGEVSEVIITSFYEGTPNVNFISSIEVIGEHVAFVMGSNSGYKHKFRNIFKDHRPAEHINVPTASLFFEALAETQKAELQSYGLVPDATRSNVYTGHVRFEHISAIAALGPIDGKFVPGQISFDGALAYTYAIKGMDFYSYISQSARTRRMAAFAKVLSGDKIVGEGVDTANFRVFRDFTDADGQDTIALTKDHDFDTLLQFEMQRFINPNITETIESSFTAPSKASFVNQAAGLVFPYFSGMTLPDKRYAYGVFSKLFVKSLSTDATKAAMLLSKIRTGFASMAFTAAGRSISHAYLGIHLSMTSQSEIRFLVEKGQYQGFTLQGEHLRLVYRNKVILPMSVELMIKECRNISPFEDVVDELVKLVKTAKTSDGKEKYKVSKDDFITSRRFVNLFRTLKLGDFPEDFKTNLSTLMTKMYYSDKFEIPSQKMIIDFLSYVATGAEEHIAGYPAYISNSYYEATDRIHIGLGIFGDRAPSLNYGSKKDMSLTIPADLTATDPLVTVNPDTKKKPLHFLPFAIVPVRQAADQWETLFKDGIIHLPTGRKGKNEFTDARKVVIQIGSDPYFSQVYKLIKEHSSIVRKSLAAGKRKRANDDTEEGPKASRKRAREEVISMAMDI